MTHKIADVFLLPLKLDETWCGIYSGEKQVFKPNFNFYPEWEREANAAIHAINHHDSLVEQVANLTDLLSRINDRASQRPNLFGGYYGVNIPSSELEQVRSALTDASNFLTHVKKTSFTST